MGKISQLTEATVLADADEAVVVDKSDTTHGVSGTTKRALLSTIRSFFAKDEDDMASDSATHFPTQQSVKAYVTAETSQLAPHRQATKSGWYLSPSGIRDTGSILVDRGYFVQIPPCGASVDRIAVEITGAGGAGSVTRLGIYSAGADGMPSDLVIDGGTIDSTTTGVKEVTIASTALDPDKLYYICVVAQVGTSPTYRRLATSAGTSTSTPPNIASSAANALSLLTTPGLITFSSFASGALPATAASPGFSNGSSAPVATVRFV